MLSDSLRRKVWEAADSYYSKGDWAHDRGHIERVLKMAVEIGRQEHANLEVLELATILHDIFEYREYHSGSEGFRHEIEGAKEARQILRNLGVKSETVEAVAHCIEAHRKRSGPPPRSLEAKCLFDADKLDCVGAIGIIRCAFISFDHKQEFYKEIGDLEAYRHENIRPDGTIIDLSKHSSNIEWELSIKDVPMRMYTETGKKLAKERAAFMQEFYDRYGKELQGFI